MYNTSITMLSQEEKVTVSFNDTPLDEVLSFLLKGRNLSWTYNDDVVVIYKRAEEVPKKNEIAADSTVTPALLTGKVTDAAGSPLPGVTVQVKGINQGTTTDADGKFVLPKVANGQILVISSVGFETRELIVNGRSILAQLNIDVSKLDETIVIAYGTTTRRLSTSNVSTIKAKDIEKQPVTNPLLALQGRVPGLVVTQSTGMPGTHVTVRIQGQNSIGRGNDPLYVIDGVPYFSQNLGTFQGASILGASINGGQLTAGNPLNYVNPTDIESIDILKDADATAIYGSRAANGAILITTKKGHSGATKVDVTLQKGWAEVGHFIDLLDSQQYMEMRREAINNDNATVSSRDYDLNGLWDTTRYTDWQKILIGGTAQHSRYSASVSGGAANTQYLVSGTYNRETTVFPGNFADTKGSVHFSINNTSQNQRFRLQVNSNYMINNSNLPAFDLTPNILLAPVAPALYNVDGSLNWAPDEKANGRSSWINPLAQLYRIYNSKATNLISNAILSYRIMPNLELKSSFGYTNLVANQYSADLIDYVAPENRPNYFRSALFSFNTAKSWIIEPQLSYNRSLGKGAIELLLGGTIQQQDNEGQQIDAVGQPNDQLLRNITAANAIYPSGADISSYKYNAVFGRLNYNWKDKYIINLVARRDGSSRFGDDNKFHNFGSIGGAWIFSEETSIRNNIPFMSFGKLRGSYGSTGSDQIGNYQYLDLYMVYNPGANYQGVISLEPTGLSNPHLRWEETRKLQLGLDVGFISNRILFSATYVRNRSSNQLLSYNLPIITGFVGVTRNFPALVQNIAWEFTVSTENIQNASLKWSTNINLTVPNNKVLSFPDLSTSSYRNRITIGRPLEEGRFFRTYRFYGVDPTSGLYQVYTSDGKPTSTPEPPKDYAVSISSKPRLYGGMQNSLSYKGIQLDFLLQFTIQKYFNFSPGNTRTTPGYFNKGLGNQPVSVLSRWQKPGDITSVERFHYNSAFAPAGDLAIQDMSFVRLKNLSISYQLSDKLIKKSWIKQCRLFMNAQNVFTITKYDGLDPESFNITTLPPLRVVALGIQLGL